MDIFKNVQNEKSQMNLKIPKNLLFNKIILKNYFIIIYTKNAVPGFQRNKNWYSQSASKGPKKISKNHRINEL